MIITSKASFILLTGMKNWCEMIKRDRNHPSLVIYNLHNERGAWPQVQDYAQMRMAHSLDPTRILTYNSSNGENPENEAECPF